MLIHKQKIAWQVELHYSDMNEEVDDGQFEDDGEEWNISLSQLKHKILHERQLPEKYNVFDTK